jgi:hypothetical protein
MQIVTKKGDTVRTDHRQYFLYVLFVVVLVGLALFSLSHFFGGEETTLKPSLVLGFTPLILYAFAFAYLEIRNLNIARDEFQKDSNTDSSGHQ